PKSEIRNLKLPENLDNLIAELGSPNLTRRMLTMNEIRDRFGANATEALSSALAKRGFAPAGGTGARLMPESLDFEAQRFAVHTMWLLQHLKDEPLDAELSSFTLAPAALVRAHALRILTERGLQAASTSDHSGGQTGLPALRDRAVAALSDPDALVQRCAAEALGAWADYENIKPLLELRYRIERAAGISPADSASGTLAASASDTHLVYAVRKALRDQLKPDGVLARLMKEKLSEQDARTIADVAIAVPSAEAGEFLLRYVQKYSEKQETLANYLRHTARYAPAKEMDSLASFTRRKFADDLDFQ